MKVCRQIGSIKSGRISRGENPVFSAFFASLLFRKTLSPRIIGIKIDSSPSVDTIYSCLAIKGITPKRLNRKMKNIVRRISRQLIQNLFLFTDNQLTFRNDIIKQTIVFFSFNCSAKLEFIANTHGFFYG